MVRFGIAGFGTFAVKRLIPGFKYAKNSQLVALARRNAEKGREDGKTYSVEHVFTSTDDLVRCPDVDAVFVTSPNALHVSDVMKCIEARKPVLCEKPFAMTVEEAEKMRDAAAKAGALLGVAHIFRFDRSVNRIRELLAQGIVGHIRFARSDFSYWGMNHGRSWINDASVAGGGPIVDVGVHCIDTLRYMLNMDPVEVSAVATHTDFFRDVEASSDMLFRFPNANSGSEVMASVHVSCLEQYRTPIEVIGTEGNLFVRDGLSVDKELTIEVYGAHDELKLREKINNFDAYGLQLDAFAAAVQGKAAFPISAEEGVKNQKILAAVYKAVESRAIAQISY